MIDCTPPPHFGHYTGECTVLLTSSPSKPKRKELGLVPLQGWSPMTKNLSTSPSLLKVPPPSHSIFLKTKPKPTGRGHSPKTPFYFQLKTGLFLQARILFWAFEMWHTHMMRFSLPACSLELWFFWGGAYFKFLISYLMWWKYSISSNIISIWYILWIFAICWLFKNVLYFNHCIALVWAPFQIWTQSWQLLGFYLCVLTLWIP